MKKWFYKALAIIAGKNTVATPVDVILAQLGDPRPLPIGRQEFEEWSERIISGALLKPGSEEEAKIFVDSQKFALANMLMHLGPHESHKPDAYFIHGLRKFGVNQVADTVRKELHEAAKVRTAAEEAAKTPEQKAVEASGNATLLRIDSAKPPCA